MCSLFLFISFKLPNFVPNSLKTINIRRGYENERLLF